MDTTNVIDYSEQLNQLNDSQNTLNQSIVDLKTYLETTLTSDGKNILIENQNDVLTRFDSIDTSLKNIDTTLQNISDNTSNFSDNFVSLNDLIDKVTSPNFVDVLKDLSHIYDTLHFSVGLFLGSLCAIAFILGVKNI